MSREIKFRAWDGELMHEVSELHFCMGPNLDGKGLKFYGPGVGSGWIDGKSIHLMQFTGLHDKNGTPIYEGDIIEYPDYSGGAYIFGKQPLARAAVKWNKDTGGYRVPGTGYSFPAGKCEVIGNIFENKDLLS